MEAPRMKAMTEQTMAQAVQIAWSEQKPLSMDHVQAAFDALRATHYTVVDERDDSQVATIQRIVETSRSQLLTLGYPVI